MPSSDSQVTYKERRCSIVRRYNTLYSENNCNTQGSYAENRHSISFNVDCNCIFKGFALPCYMGVDVLLSTETLYGFYFRLTRTQTISRVNDMCMFEYFYVGAKKQTFNAPPS